MQVDYNESDTDVMDIDTDMYEHNEHNEHNEETYQNPFLSIGNVSLYQTTTNFELRIGNNFASSGISGFFEENLGCKNSSNPPNHSKNPPKTLPKTNPRRNAKRQCTTKNKIDSDDDLLKALFEQSDSYSSSDSYGSDDSDGLDCPNPLCDHKNFTDEELDGSKKEQKVPEGRLTIDDLINLGKRFHCKKNREYFGINLRILCNLVTPLTELKNLVGMIGVKEHIVDQIIFFLQGFNEKQRCNSCIDCAYGLSCAQNANVDMLHTVITGPPGVGKTELGKILGHIYKGMGILKSGHVNIASRADLVAKYLGQTAPKTQGFIDKCAGGVMFIDEAYSLGNPEGRDSFSKECIDTLTRNLSERRDFLCIIAGYKDALDRCFFAYNEGLKRRFTFRYDIEGYNSDELMEIFLHKVSKEGWLTEFHVDENQIDQEKMQMLKSFFNKNMEYFPHFGGDIETLFLNCKIAHGRRVLFKDPSVRKILTIRDIEIAFDIFVSNRRYKEKNEEVPISAQMMYL